MQEFQLTGRVSADFGSQLEVLCPNGNKHRLTQFSHLQRPLVGDIVQFQAERLLDILPRNNQLTRLKSNGETQALAANLDEVWLCLPLDREPSVGRLERFSHFAQSQGFTPLVLLTKLDLCENPQAWVGLATATGLEVILCSTVENIGMEALRSRLAKGKTMLLLGQSGVGKTSLANLLAGTNHATLPVRDLDHRGQHATVTRRLIPVADGGFILDMPGLRELAWEEQTQLPDAWGKMAENCRFSNCRHQGEEGCALEQAVAMGDISQDSLSHWRKMQKEEAYQTRRMDKTESANSKKRWKTINKQMRARRKQEPW